MKTSAVMLFQVVQLSKIVKKLVPKKRLESEVGKAAFMNVDELTRNVNCHQKSQLIKIMNSLWNFNLVRCHIAGVFSFSRFIFKYNFYDQLLLHEGCKKISLLGKISETSMQFHCYLLFRKVAF